MPYRPPHSPQLQDPKKRGSQGFSGNFIQKPQAIGISTVKPRRKSSVKYLDNRVAYLLSVITHISLPIWFIILNVLLFLILGIELKDLFTSPPEPKPKDIVFVLTPPNQPEQAPINPDTHMRADQDMRAGGEHNPTKPVLLAENIQQAAPAIVQAPSQPDPNLMALRNLQVRPPTPPKKEVESPPVEEPSKPPAASSLRLSKPIEPVPLPGKSPIIRNSDTGTNGNKRPEPLMADSAGGLQASASSASPGSVGSTSNPSPGNKYGPLGVDAIKEPDFGPYMKDLQRRIKQMWSPPRGNESKRVIVVFRVNREGKLMKIKVTHSSGEPTADQAAIAAIEQTFPFKPLPQEYTEEDIDIEFTFDYNVFGEKQRMEKEFRRG